MENDRCKHCGAYCGQYHNSGCRMLRKGMTEHEIFFQGELVATVIDYGKGFIDFVYAVISADATVTEVTARQEVGDDVGDGG